MRSGHPITEIINLAFVVFWYASYKIGKVGVSLHFEGKLILMDKMCTLNMSQSLLQPCGINVSFCMLGNWKGRSGFTFLREIHNNGQIVHVEYVSIIFQPCGINVSLCMYKYKNDLHA